MASVVVRPFEPGEWRTLRALRLAALGDAPDAFRRSVAEEARRPEAAWAEMLEAVDRAPDEVSLLATLETRPVGLAYARLESAAPDRAELNAMWVEPAARRAGAGLALVRAAVTWARGRGAREMVLQVTEGNASAERLYVRAGFRPTGEASSLRPGSPLRTRTLRLVLAEDGPARQSDAGGLG